MIALDFSLCEKKYANTNIIITDPKAVSYTHLYQNDKDTYIDAQKTKYSTLLDKWNAYMRSVGTAVQKFTAYTRNAVK